MDEFDARVSELDFPLQSPRAPDEALRSRDTRPRPGPNLYDLAQLDVRWEEEKGILWAFMTPSERPNYSPAVLRDSLRCLDSVRETFAGQSSPLRYMVVGSRFPGVFNLGGDLESFARWAEAGDREALIRYGLLCVELIHRVWSSNDMPMINIALVQGDAFGGGLESMLCFDAVIAERQARFCLPEIKFGLFPGMGAFSLLARKLGHVAAERMIRSGATYSAEEFLELGLITEVVESGEGEEAVREYVEKIGHRHQGYLGMFAAGRRVTPIQPAELREIVELWADTAISLPPASLKMMRRLAAAQTRITRNDVTSRSGFHPLGV